MEALLEGEAKVIARKAIEMAKEGDTTALRLCMDRLMPARKDRHVPFALPKLETAADTVKASAALVEVVAKGELRPRSCRRWWTASRAVEAHDREQRLRRLEAQSAAGA